MFLLCAWLLAGVGAAEAGERSSRSVCELQLRSDGVVASRGACPGEVVGAAETLVRSARGAWSPHPTEVVVDGVTIRRVRVVLGRGAPKVRLRPMAKVAHRVLPTVSATVGAPESCTVAVQVDTSGAVTQAEALTCAGAAMAVQEAVSAWRFRPLVLNEGAVVFHTTLTVPVLREAEAAPSAEGIETTGDVLNQ